MAMSISEPEPSEDEAPTSAAPRAVDWENPRVSAILAAAASCFARSGFSATTLAEIGRELGLRKSIVHYYFASKTALIHEVQSLSYHRYVGRVRAALEAAEGPPTERAVRALSSLWEEIKRDQATTALNVEVWAAARRDAELKRRSAALQRDARQLIANGVVEALGATAERLSLRTEALSALILATLNGLAVTDYLEETPPQTDEAFQLFLHLLTLGLEKAEQRSAKAP